MSDSNDSAKALNLAKECLRERRFDNAVRLLNQAIESDADNSKLHECLATACFLTGDLDGALKGFQQVTRLKPLEGSAWINIGAVHNRMGNYREAVKALRKGLQRDKRSSQGYYNLGIAQKSLKQLAMAATAYKEAIRIDPGMAEAHQNLGNIYLDMNNNRQAVKSFKKALELRPDFDRAKRGLAIAENAISDGRKNANPFGRLVSQEDLAAQKSGQTFRELDSDERLEDRHLIRGHTAVVREHVQELADHLKNDLEPLLLSLSRSVSGSAGRELAGIFEKFRAVLNTTRSAQAEVRQGMVALREHEERVRSE